MFFDNSGGDIVSRDSVSCEVSTGPSTGSGVNCTSGDSVSCGEVSTVSSTERGVDCTSGDSVSSVKYQRFHQQPEVKVTGFPAIPVPPAKVPCYSSIALCNGVTSDGVPSLEKAVSGNSWFSSEKTGDSGSSGIMINSICAGRVSTTFV